MPKQKRLTTDPVVITDWLDFPEVFKLLLALRLCLRAGVGGPGFE